MKTITAIAGLLLAAAMFALIFGALPEYLLARPIPALPDTVVACRGDQSRIDSLFARLEAKSKALDRKLDSLKKDTSFVKEYIIR